MKKDILAYTYEELQQQMEQIGQKRFRAKQIYEWLHVKLVEDFTEMSNIPKTLQEVLAEEFWILPVTLIERQQSAEDGTNKFLFQLSDGHMIESVLMRYQHGNSVCISSQVGCRMGCCFCASGIDGLERNLQVGEMLGQIYRIQKLTGERVANIVVMGTGEPLDNYRNFLKFVRLISSEDGLHISQRNITVSTCGLVPQIRELAQENLQITLALSLHGATQEKRSSLMPIANKYSLTEVLAACDEYFHQTGRRITFEYSLIRGVNDTLEDANELGKLLKGRNCHLNLIPVNPIKERQFEQPNKKNALNFKNKLEKNGINVTIRREMGTDIDGACGQLRRKFVSSTSNCTEQIEIELL